MATTLGLYGGPITARGPVPAKTAAGLPAFGPRIEEFDTWRQGYAGAVVLVVVAGTTQHARLFSNPTLSTPLPNPIVLLTLTDENGATYGKWPVPVYTGDPYFLTINETEATGVSRPPLTDVSGLNISRAIAATARGGWLQTVEAILDKEINAADFGSLSSANGAQAVTAVVNRAISAAAAQGGGMVRLPAGNVVITNVTLPVGVILAGQGPSATTLSSTVGGVVILIADDGAGLHDLTLDGVNLNTGSVGLVAIGLVAVSLQNLIVKRFWFGGLMRGVSYSLWDDVTFTNCVVGIDIRGDMDATAGNDGSEVRGLRWRGGGASLCTSAGIKLTFFDALVDGVTLDALAVVDNIGFGIVLNGARNVRVIDLQGNAAGGQNMLHIQDDTDLSRRASNTTDHITFVGSTFRGGGNMSFSGTCASVAFERCDFRGSSFVLSVPENPILLIDCIEDGSTTAIGDLDKLARRSSADEFSFVGTTSDGTAMTAVSILLGPGQVALAQAEIVAQRQDGTTWGFFWKAVGAERPGSTLTFDTQSVNFTVGSVATGTTSGATARIMAVTQSAGSGTLTLGDINGTFLLGEGITDAAGGIASTSGLLTGASAALDGGGNTDVRAPALSAATTYAAAWDVSGAILRLRVTGTAGHLVQWTCRVRKLVS